MSLDVWFKEDIKNTLLALNETSRDTHTRLSALTVDSAAARVYRAGYGDALRAVAIAFGICAPQASDSEPMFASPRLPSVWTTTIGEQPPNGNSDSKR